MKKPTIVSKPLLAAVAAVVVTCSVPPSLWAAEPQTADESEMAAGAAPDAGAAAAAPMAFPSPQEMVKRLQTKLSLSAEQASALTPIIASRQEKLKAVLADTGMRRMKRGRALREIVAESDKQINALLTPEQQKQYAQIEKQLHEELKQRMRERSNAGAG
jgi:hypothetical protein